MRFWKHLDGVITRKKTNIPETVSKTFIKAKLKHPHVILVRLNKGRFKREDSITHREHIQQDRVDTIQRGRGKLVYLLITPTNDIASLTVEGVQLHKEDVIRKHEFVYLGLWNYFGKAVRRTE